MLRFIEAEAAQDNSHHGNDGYAIDHPNDLLVVCDGVSSVDGNGQRAANQFVEKFQENDSIRQTITELIDEKIHKTTIVVARIRTDILEVCSIGDSRVYIVRGESIVQLTKDQNLFGMIEGQLPWKGQHLEPEEMRTVLLQGFSQQLTEIIAEELLGDKTKDIFLPRRMKRFLSDFKKSELFETCEQEQKTRGCSETFLAEVIRVSPSFLIHHLANPHSKTVIRTLRANVEVGDELLLTTDGLHGSFGTNEDLFQALHSKGQNTAAKIVEAAKDSPDRRRDDMTVVYARIGEA